MNKNEKLLKHMVELLELPDSAYEKAVNRYEDIGEWLGRDESSCCDNNVHVFAQGSFRLGTAIRPLSNNEEYDLDLACNLRSGITPSRHTQKQLKDLIGNELQAYREFRGIKNKVEKKHRCWRLEYADDLCFHMDIVPCIPELTDIRDTVFESIQNARIKGMTENLARDVSALAVAITDDRRHDYELISNDWLISNPEGYAKWFDFRMRANQSELQIALEHAQVDDIPSFKRKTILQRIVQLLKRHRDVMFADAPDSKPISVIITTISAESYDGETSLEDSLNSALNKLKEFANSERHFLPNPVNPKENFADRWSMPQYAHLRLKDNFVAWVDAAIRDFTILGVYDDIKILNEFIESKMSVKPSEDKLKEIFGVSATVSAPQIITTPKAKPWVNGE